MTDFVTGGGQHFLFTENANSMYQYVTVRILLC